MSKKYTEEDIKVLDPITAIRKRPGMYVGVDEDGLFQLFKEVADNTIDESLAGRNNALHIVLEKNEVWIKDNGEGIPVGKNKETGMSTLKSILEVPHSGGKFDKGAYDSVIGTHGIGLTAVNALSSRLDVWTNRNDKLYHTSYEKGQEISSVQEIKLQDSTILDKWKDKFNSGTIIKFIPDKKILEGKLNKNRIKEYCEISSYLNEKFKITYKDKKEKLSWYSENGLSDYLDKRNKDNDWKEIKKFTLKSESCDLGLSFIENSTYSMRGFTNTSYNPDGGTHVNELTTIIFKCLDKFKSKGQQFEKIDTQRNYSGILNVKLIEAKLSGQTKNKLVDSRGKDAVQSCKKQLEKFFDKNSNLAKVLCDLASSHYNSRKSILNNNEFLKKIKNKNKLPTKMAAAPKCSPQARELYICEGESASGTGIKARHSTDYQEVLGLKGKPVNVLRAPLEKIVKNEEIINIFNAIGFDPKKNSFKDLRVQGKVILMADPDPDGYHIQLLLLTVFATLCPVLFEKQIVYTVDAPEYMAEYKKKYFHGESPDDIYNQAGTDKLHIEHIKGWGAVDPLPMRHLAFDPNTRRLKKIVPPLDGTFEKFNQLMLNNPEYRKQVLGI